MNDWKLEENVVILPCQHLYHFECITQWFKTSNICPLCRQEFPTDDPEYEARRKEKSSQNVTLNQEFDEPSQINTSLENNLNQSNQPNQSNQSMAHSRTNSSNENEETQNLDPD